MALKGLLEADYAGVAGAWSGTGILEEHCLETSWWQTVQWGATAILKMTPLAH